MFIETTLGDIILNMVASFKNKKMQVFPNCLFARGNIDTTALVVDIGPKGKSSSVVREKALTSIVWLFFF